MDKGIFVKDIADGHQVEGIFLVKQMTRAETRTGSPYLMMTIMDASGEIPGRVWDNADALFQPSSPGNIIFLNGQAQAYKETLQLKINHIEVVQYDRLEDLLPATRQNIGEMTQKLRHLLGQVSDPFLHRLLQNFFNDADFLAEFQKTPAAKNMHHAYIGGLLEHTLSVVELADSIAGHYPVIDRSLLLSGAFLHDIGKVREFSFEIFPFNYTDEGRLVGHLVMGIEMIREKTATIPEFPADLAARLKHLILSHHGRHEFGSPTVPMMLEAFILHHIDDMDAKVNFIEHLASGLDEDEYGWSDYQRTLERFLFMKGNGRGGNAEPAPTQSNSSPADNKTGVRERENNATVETKEKNGISSKQTSLF